MLNDEEIKQYFISKGRYKDDIVTTYLNEIGKIPMLTQEETEDLFKKYNNGDQNAKEKLVESNLRLVVAVAKAINQKVILRAIPEPIALIDLIQEGSIGLITAVEKYDLSKGCRFSTYAFWRIRKSINDAILNTSKLIRKPVNLSFELDKIYKVRKNLADKLLRTLTNQELADALGINIKKLERLLSIPENSISIDTIIGEDDFTIKDVLEDETINIEESYIEQETNEQLYELISELPDREREILMNGYGIAGLNEARKSLAAKYEISQERVRQIEVNAVKHLQEGAQKGRLNNPFR